MVAHSRWCILVCLHDPLHAAAKLSGPKLIALLSYYATSLTTLSILGSFVACWSRTNHCSHIASP